MSFLKKEIARERVLFGRPLWHTVTRVQKLGKCPPLEIWCEIALWMYDIGPSKAQKMLNESDRENLYLWPMVVQPLEDFFAQG